MSSVSEIPCRGCFVRYRNNVWLSYLRKKHEDPTSVYLDFEFEPNNKYDPNAIKVVCKGALNGNLGYVAKERTAEVKEHYDNGDAHIIEMKDEKEANERTVHLLVKWN